MKTEFALGKGRTEQSVAHSEMLDPQDVAAAILLACTQSAKSRIIEIRMRTMAPSPDVEIVRCFPAPNRLPAFALKRPPRGRAAAFFTPPARNRLPHRRSLKRVVR